MSSTLRPDAPAWHPSPEYSNDVPTPKQQGKVFNGAVAPFVPEPFAPGFAPEFFPSIPLTPPHPTSSPIYIYHPAIGYFPSHMQYLYLHTPPSPPLPPPAYQEWGTPARDIGVGDWPTMHHHHGEQGEGWSGDYRVGDTIVNKKNKKKVKRGGKSKEARSRNGRKEREGEEKEKEASNVKEGGGA